MTGQAESSETFYPIFSVPTEINLSHEVIAFYGGGARGEVESMGLTGLSYLFQNSSLLFGAGGYGATSGRRGGFFVVGTKIGYIFPLFPMLRVKSEFFAGGGGGGGSPQGGGLMLRPAVSLHYLQQGGSLGLGVASVRFPSGRIDSSQFFLEVSLPDAFVYQSPSSRPELSSLSLPSETTWERDRWYLIPAVRVYDTSGKVSRGGNAHQNKAGLLGFMVYHDISDSFFATIESFGTVHGGIGGYMSFSSGVGFRYPIIASLSLEAKLDVGAAGGGDVDTGGGMIIQPSLFLVHHLSPRFALHFGPSFLFTDGSFDVPAFTVGFSSQINRAIQQEPTPFLPTSTSKALDILNCRGALSSERYFLKDQTARHSSEKLRDIDLFGLNFDYFLNDRFFLNAGTYWAYEGGAGGYASAQLGLGVRFPFSPQFSFEAKGGVGSGAGGGVPTGSGAIFSYHVGMEWRWKRDYALLAALGERQFMSGGKTVVAEMGMGYSFGIPILSASE